jgi:hypothetical protein
MQGHTVVTDEQALMAFYSFRVDLNDRHAVVAEMPHAPAIALTRSLPP